MRLCSRVRKESSGDSLTEVEDLGSLAAKALGTGLTSVEVVLALLTSNNLAVLGDFQALRV